MLVMVKGKKTMGTHTMNYDNEPYELIIEDIDTDGNDNLDWSRNDATGSTVSEPLTCEGQLIEDSDSDSDFNV